MTKPGGTGSPIRVISARFAPLPPSRSLRSLLPSTKSYTYLGIRLAPHSPRSNVVYVGGTAAARSAVGPHGPRDRGMQCHMALPRTPVDRHPDGRIPTSGGVMQRLAKDLVTGLGGAALIAALACSPPVRRRSLTYGATPQESAR